MIWSVLRVAFGIGKGEDYALSIIRIKLTEFDWLLEDLHLGDVLNLVVVVKHVFGIEIEHAAILFNVVSFHLTMVRNPEFITNGAYRNS